MSSQPPTGPVPAAQQTDADGDADADLGFSDAYTAALEASGIPLLGYMALYSIFDGRVTPDQLEIWFRDLDLDPMYLPGPIRPLDVFERITGKSGVRRSYSLDDPTGSRVGRRPVDGTAREALLMVRHVRRDGEQLVRHVVREVRDEGKKQLSYDTRLAEVTFVKDNAPGADSGTGAMKITPDHAAIGALPEQEGIVVAGLLTELEDTYKTQCAFLRGDRLRALVRSYIEGLDAVRIRPTGGVYFVAVKHARTLAALRQLVARMGARSQLSRVPLPDQAEQRDMVVRAFTTRAKDDLTQLAAEIAAAAHEGRSAAAVQTLYKRFEVLKASAAAHSELLANTLDDTAEAMKLVQLQLVSLLASADGEPS